MSGYIEIEEFVTPKSVEWAHGRAQIAMTEHRQGFADAGWRAALARDPKLLKVLERGAEIVDKLSEEQMGRTRRADAGRTRMSSEHTEAALWREAYRLCDEGNPIRNFEWIYGAAALLCGFID